MEENNTNIDELIKRLPKDYAELCSETKAIERSRIIKTPYVLIKLAFMYMLGEYSLLQMSVIARLKGMGDFSDTAFMKKFGKCRKWFEKLIERIKTNAIISYQKP